MNKVFFFLPFFMFGGTAFQGGGLYVFAILLPAFFMQQNIMTSHDNKKCLLVLSLSLAGLFLIFPLSNFINYFLPFGDLLSDLSRPESIKFSSLIKSRLSTAMLGSAIFLAGFSFYFGRKIKKKEHDVNNSDEKSLQYFTYGLAVACSILAVYIIYQHLTGFDYKEESLQLSSTKKLVTTGTYRVLGFYGHPLSIAGASLGLYSFYLVLFFKNLKCRHLNDKELAQRLCFPNSAALYLYISLLNLLFIVLSGGRFAVLLALLLSVVYPFVTTFSKVKNSVKLGVGFVLTSSSLLILQLSGVLSRYSELWGMWGEGRIHRLKFWQVYWHMFLDKPWFGHGYAWLKTYSREIYYKRLGLGDFDHKYNAHNLYLEILANVGIVGALAMLLCLVFVLKSLKKIALNSNSAFLYRAFSVALFANLLNCLTQNALFDSNVLYIYLFLMWFIVWQKPHTI